MKKDCNNDELKSVSFWDEAIGGAPGGTIATLYANLEGKARKAPKENIDPFLKLSDGTKSVYNCISNNPYGMEKATSPWDVPDSKSSSNNEDRWCTPYVMAGVNYMVVRWQYALRHLQVDNKNISNTIMTYREVNAHSNFQTAMTTYLGLMYLGSMLFNPVTSYLLRHYVFPKPGEGPPMNDMENKRTLFYCHDYLSDSCFSFFSKLSQFWLYFMFLVQLHRDQPFFPRCLANDLANLVLYSFYGKDFLCVSGEGIGVNGNVVETIFYLPKDAGCLETSRMLVESGLSLALEEQKLPVKGGFYPPSIALGNDILLNRLVQTGTTFTSRVVPSKK